MKIDKESIRQKLLNKNSNCHCLTTDEFLFIHKNFKPTHKDDFAGRDWFKIYCEGHDPKYTHRMICFEAEQIRPSNFMEFYGGGVVD